MNAVLKRRMIQSTSRPIDAKIVFVLVALLSSAFMRISPAQELATKGFLQEISLNTQISQSIESRTGERAVSAVVAQTTGVIPETTVRGRGRNQLPSRGGIQAVFSRSEYRRFRIPFETFQPVILDKENRVKLQAPEFLLSWARRELPLRFPGIDKIEFAHELTARRDEVGTGAQIQTYFEVSGAKSAAAKGAEFLTGIIALGNQRFGGKVRMFVQEPSPDQVARTRVAVFDRRGLSRELLSLRKAGCQELPHISFSGTMLKGVEVSALKTLRYLKSLKVEEISGQKILSPQIAKVFEGVQAQISTFMLPEGDGLALSVDIGLGVLTRPIAEKELRLPDFPRVVKVMEPELATLRWSSDRLMLSASAAGVVVKGLLYPAKLDREKAAQNLILVIELSTERLPTATVLGEVLGYDSKLGLAFARCPLGSELHPGQKLRVTRNNRLVAAAKVVEIIGTNLTIRPDKKVARGDILR